jgi:DNA topoisomerase-1
MDGSRGQGGPPGRACDPIRVSRAVGQKLAESGQISTAAVDQVYEVRNHPLLETLDKPDPYGNFSRKKLIGLMVSYFDVVGSGYLVPEGNGWDWRDRTERAKGPPEFLWVIYPQYTIPYRGAGTPIVQHFQYFNDQIPLSACLWFKHNLSLRDPYGSAYGPTQAGESYRRQEQEFNALFSQVMALGPRPNMIATAKDPLMPPGKNEADALKIDLIRQQSGGYAGGVLVNTGAFDFTPASYQPADLAGKELSEYDIYALAAIFDQPATYYTINSNLANLQAADKQYDENGVQPRCDTIADTFTALAKSFDPRLSFRFDPGLAEDQLIKAQVDKIYVDMGAMTLNQLNEEKKFPPVPWGNQPWLPGTLQQPSMMTATHEAALKTADQAVDSAGQKDDLAVKGHKEAADQQDHQQSMDKANLEVDKKAASKPAPKRSLEDELDSVIGEIRTELEITRKAGNPNHVPSGEHGGEFTSGSGGGSAAGNHGHAPGKHHAKNARKAAKKRAEKPKKVKAHPVRGHMAEAKREGTGKNARIVMADGSSPPSHVTPGSIAPNWTNVHVSTDPKAEVLVTGKDPKGRPVMVTSDSYAARSAAVKFERVKEMIGQHDKIGKEIQEARKGPNKEEADAAYLMHTQATRPGSDTDTKSKVKAYGATTLEARHVVSGPDGVRLQFIGKKGVPHDHLIHDKELATMLVDRKNAASGPDGKLFNTSDTKVRAFTATLDGGKFTPKDFRTSRATVLATEAVKADPTPSSGPKEHQARIKAVAERVSSVLGNRPAEALKSYIHPAVFAPWGHH